MFSSFGGSFRLGKRPGVITDPTKLVNLQVWYNADVSNATNFGTAPANGGAVGAWKDRSGTGHDANQSGNASYFNGDIGEIVMFTRTLNTSDILNTEAYLKYHWAL